MSDENQNINRSIEAVRRLTKQVDDLLQLLLSQRELLKERGMTLPTGSLDNLRALRVKLDSITMHVTNRIVELRRLRALAETTALINSALEPDAVLNQVMDTVINITGAERGYIVLKNRETGEFDQFRVARGIETEQLADHGDEPHRRGEFIVSRTIVNDVAASGVAVLTDNASTDRRYSGQQSIVGFGLRSILAVPLKVREEVIGVVYCDNRILAGLFQDSDLDILKAFSNQAGVAIENARLFVEARHQLEQITEIRDLMDNVFDSIANGVITVDAFNKVSTCNAAARRLLGMPLKVDPVGHQLDVILPDMGEGFIEALQNVRETGDQQLLEFHPLVSDLGRRNWNIIISSLREDGGRTQGLALVLDDLTEKKQRESQLAELRRYLPGALIDNVGNVGAINIRGQERTITAIATDVRGFTSFSERIAPESVMEIINQYLSLASDSINLYEGIVDKYMGDAVTGLFNTQLNPQEDHAVRAVRAAMTIIFDLYALHEIMPEEQRLFYGIGIHTGPAFLGNVGSPDRQEFSAIGEATSVAKQLEAMAKPGEIIISAATFQAVEPFFECESRQPDKVDEHYPLDVVYKVLKRRKGVNTGQLLLDPELAELLADIGTED